RRRAPGPGADGSPGADPRRRAAHRRARGPRGRSAGGRSAADASEPRRQPRLFLRHGAVPGAPARRAAPADRAAERRRVCAAHPGSAHARPGAVSAPGAATGMKARVRWLVIVALVVFGSLAAWRFVLAPPRVDPGVVTVSGRIEGDDSAVAAKTSGRIREISVREGDRLQAGQVIAILDDEQIRAREQQAQAAVRQAEARARLAGHQVAVLEEQLRQSRLGVDQARTDAQGRVSEADAKLAAAEAQLAQAEASWTQAKWDREAMGNLFKRELVAEQEARRAVSAEEAQAAVVVAARRQVEAARGALTAARANLVNPAIRSSQVAAV